MTQLLYLGEEGNYVREFKAQVTEVDHEAGALVLDRTHFYPKGGNQDWDTGKIIVGETELLISSVVKERKGAERVLHVVVDEKRKLLANVISGADVQGQIDWGRRLKHMMTHTSQHLLSALIKRDRGLDTVGVDITTQHGMIRLGDTIPPRDLFEAQEIANGMIADNVGTRRELNTGTGRYEMVIGEVDRRECGGTHVSNLAQIERICIVRLVEGGRQLFFHVGEDARVATSDLFTDGVGMRNLFPDTVENVAGFADWLSTQEAERTVLQRRQKEIVTELLGYRLREMVEINGVKVVFVDCPELKAKDVQKIAQPLTKESDRVIVVRCANSSLLILSSDQRVSAGAIMEKCKKEGEGVKGGGNPNFAQGGPWNDSFEKLQAVARSVIEM